jgi:hypothetical protein
MPRFPRREIRGREYHHYLRRRLRLPTQKRASWKLCLPECVSPHYRRKQYQSRVHFQRQSLDYDECGYCDGHCPEQPNFMELDCEGTFDQDIECSRAEVPGAGASSPTCTRSKPASQPINNTSSGPSSKPACQIEWTCLVQHPSFWKFHRLRQQQQHLPTSIHHRPVWRHRPATLCTSIPPSLRYEVDRRGQIKLPRG